MISRRNYLSITIMMGIIFFLFLFSGAAKTALSHYEINEYALEKKDILDADTKAMTQTDAGCVLYLGSSENMERMARQWCSYRHYAFTATADSATNYTLALIDGEALTDENVDAVFALYDRQIPLVFGTMPSVKMLRAHTELDDMLGITNIQKNSVALEGMTLYENFLVGGKVIYRPLTLSQQKQQDLKLNLPWFILGSGTKVYMDGILPDQFNTTDAAYKPPVIWRYRTGSNTVFAVNTDFMQSDIGLGILTAMEGELSQYYVYPVVNTQNILALNYPSFAKENTEQLRSLYSRDATSVLRDLVWPGIVAVAEHNHAYPSVFLSSKLDYSSEEAPVGEDLPYYLQLLREQHGEAGISLVPWKGATVGEKLAQDKQFLDENADEYTFQVAYAGEMSASEAVAESTAAGFDDIVGIVRDYDTSENIIGTANGRMVLQVTNTGSSHTYREDLRTKSIQTLLGYSVIGQDFAKLMYPEGKQDQWEKVFDRYSRYTNTYWQNYDYFDETTISEGVLRTSRYLNATYDINAGSKGLTISSNASKKSPLYFVLKCDNTEPVGIRGGSYKKMEDGRYLIQATRDTTVIRFEQESELTFWR